MALSNTMAANAAAVVAKLDAKVVPPGKSKKRRVSPLKCSEVRWFLRKDNDSKWIPLRGYDSLVLETAYRERNGVQLDEEAIIFRDQLPQTPKPIVLDGLYRLKDWDGGTLDWNLKSIYWKDEEDTNLIVRRGTWFTSDGNQPISMKLAEAIENHHLKHFKDQVIPEVPVFSESEASKKPVLTSMEWSEYEEVKWNSVIDVSLHNNKGNRLTRLFRGKGMTMLRRAYTEEAKVEDGKPNFSDLILVVHGIGQKGYENLIAKNTTQIREGIMQIMEKQYAKETRRPMVLPVEWRSCLKLDENASEVITLPRMQSMRHTLNSIAMDIMYYQSPLYRTEIINGVIRCLNCTYRMFLENNPGFDGSVSIFAHSLGSVIVYDILTNWSPLLLYDDFVTNAIKEQLKELDETKDQKEFEVLKTFHESRKALLETDGKLQEILLKREENIKFKVKNLFCVGSPLAIFLIMRGADVKTLVPRQDQVERMFNMFHPYDPVAYRLEPLFHENYRHIRPVKMFYYADERALMSYESLPFDVHKSYLKAAKKKAKKLMNSKAPDDDAEEADEVDSDSGECSYTSSPRSQSPYMSDDMHENRAPERPPPPKSNTSSSWWKFGSGTAAQSAHPPEVPEIEVGQEPEPNKPLSAVEALLNGVPPEKRIPRRLDFAIQPSITEKSYWSMLRSHFGYWTNLDTIGFVLNVIYPAPPKEIAEKVEEIVKKEEKKSAKSKEKEKVKTMNIKDHIKVENQLPSSSLTPNRNSMIDTKSVGGESKGSVEAELEAIQKENKENAEAGACQVPNAPLYPSMS